MSKTFRSRVVRMLGTGWLLVLPLSLTQSQEKNWSIYSAANLLATSCSIDSVVDGRLYVTAGTNLVSSFPIQTITLLRKVRETTTYNSAMYGSIIGVVAGLATVKIVWNSGGRDDGTFLGPPEILMGLFGGALVGGAVGTVVGLAAGADTDYDLTARSEANKILAVRSIVAEERPRNP